VKGSDASSPIRSDRLPDVVVNATGASTGVADSAIAAMSPGTNQVSVQPTPTIAVAAPVAATPAASPAPAPTHVQVSGVLSTLRVSGDGTHRIVLALHPADLGPVNIVARLDRGELTVQLASASDAARAALHSAMPQLRHELQQAGFAGVNVSMSTGDRSDGPGTGPGRTPVTPASRSPGAGLAPAPAPAPSAQTVNSGLDRWL
jgi:hypothetical protein